MVANFDVDIEDQLRKGHPLAPLPKEMHDDIAFMDHIHTGHAHRRGRRASQQTWNPGAPVTGNITGRRGAPGAMQAAPR